MNPVDVSGLIQMLTGCQALAGLVSLEVAKDAGDNFHFSTLCNNTQLLVHALGDVRDTLEEMRTDGSKLFDFLEPNEN
jgi:hypothetical protein